jgi:hypothetical protein
MGTTIIENDTSIISPNIIKEKIRRLKTKEAYFAIGSQGVGKGSLVGKESAVSYSGMLLYKTGVNHKIDIDNLEQLQIEEYPWIETDEGIEISVKENYRFPRIKNNETVLNARVYLRWADILKIKKLGAELSLNWGPRGDNLYIYITTFGDQKEEIIKYIKEINSKFIFINGETRIQAETKDIERLTDRLSKYGSFKDFYEYGGLSIVCESTADSFPTLHESVSEIVNLQTVAIIGLTEETIQERIRAREGGDEEKVKKMANFGYNTETPSAINLIKNTGGFVFANTGTYSEWQKVSKALIDYNSGANRRKNDFLNDNSFYLQEIERLESDIENAKNNEDLIHDNIKQIEFNLNLINKQIQDFQNGYGAQGSNDTKTELEQKRSDLLERLSVLSSRKTLLVREILTNQNLLLNYCSLIEKNLQKFEERELNIKNQLRIREILRILIHSYDGNTELESLETIYEHLKLAYGEDLAKSLIEKANEKFNEMVERQEFKFKRLFRELVLAYRVKDTVSGFRIEKIIRQRYGIKDFSILSIKSNNRINKIFSEASRFNPKNLEYEIDQFLNRYLSANPIDFRRVFANRQIEEMEYADALKKELKNCPNLDQRKFRLNWIKERRGIVEIKINQGLEADLDSSIGEGRVLSVNSDILEKPKDYSNTESHETLTVDQSAQTDVKRTSQEPKLSMNHVLELKNNMQDLKSRLYNVVRVQTSNSSTDNPKIIKIDSLTYNLIEMKELLLFAISVFPPLYKKITDFINNESSITSESASDLGHLISNSENSKKIVSEFLRLLIVLNRNIESKLQKEYTDLKVEIN